MEETITQYLRTWKGQAVKEIAFYGGTFTAMDADIQEKLLLTAYRFIQNGLVDELRVSTRPDAVDDKKLDLLKRYGVTTVELGVQSMDNAVLKKSGRGHASEDTRTAVRLLRGNGFKIGVQIMPGLPGDTDETILYTAYKVADMVPDFIRIYPALVIKDTPLERLYLKGLYKPWQLKDMIIICSKIMTVFEKYRIPVVRVGLYVTEDLKQNIVAGPMHPSFRQLAERIQTDVRG